MTGTEMGLLMALTAILSAVIGVALGGLEITVTGDATNPVRWGARADLTKVSS